MSTIKVVDVNNEEGKEETPEVEAIEETKEEIKEETPEPINEVVEQQSEEVKPKRQTQKDKITCPKCFKEMTVKSYKYSHEKNCGGQLSEKPVKPQAKPKAKQKASPKPPPEPAYYESSEEEQQPQQKTIKKKQPVVQPINHTTALAQHYQLLQQEMVKQKQERYKSLCMNMFSSKTKKR